MEKSKRVVGYARVSTEAQDITRQIELITAYCSDRNYHLIKIIQEKISGARKDRKSLNELLDVDDAVADMIIVSELSRLSREDDILSVLSTINELLKQGVDILFLDKQDRIYKAGTILSLYDTRSFAIVGPICSIPLGKQISSPWLTILPTGEITAAVPQRPHSAKSFTSSKYTSLSSTSSPR